MNQSQNEIITNNEFITNRQALCVVACAGSGKTTTIINKIKYMIEELKCNSTDFIICTFTNNSVEDIINRINIDGLNISTFHSMALQELIKYNYKIIPNTPEPIPEEYLIKYLDLLNTTSYIYRFKYIFIDEYQDINQLQYDIIQKWFVHCKLLLVVGDDQQNIYSFRDTSIRYILNFPTDFSGEYKYLSINYRSNKGIVDLSDAIIKFNSDRIEKTIIAYSNKPIIKPKIRFFHNQIDEYKYIIKHILKIKELYNNESIAILCRTNKKLYNIENYLYLNTDNNIISDINLLTIHGSKGLEFDNVLIINCVDGLFPLNDTPLEEERRLFYVGCTRAKKTLLITSMWDDINKPSRFIYELYKSNINLINIIPFEWDLEQTKIYTNTNINTNTNTNITKKSLSNILSNLNITMYNALLDKSLLPTINKQIYKLINIHQPLNTDIDNFIQLYTQRIIYENIEIDNYLYVEYIINEPKFKQHNKILKSNIKKYLNNQTNNELLISSIEYIRSNTNIHLQIDKKDMQTIYNILTTKNNIYFDMNLISNKNKVILTNSYLKFQNKNIKSIDILQSIYNLSICNDLIYGKYSNQNKLNEQLKQLNQIILTDIDNYIHNIIIESTYIDYDYYIIIENNIIGKINLIIDNSMLIINLSKPTINDYIKYLLMIHKYNTDNQTINQLNIIKLYNPINGTIIEWDIIDYSIIELYNYLIN